MPPLPVLEAATLFSTISVVGWTPSYKHNALPVPFVSFTFRKQGTLENRRCHRTCKTGRIFTIVGTYFFCSHLSALLPRILRRRKFILFLHCPCNILHKDFFHETEEKDGRSMAINVPAATLPQLMSYFPIMEYMATVNVFLLLALIYSTDVYIIPAGKEHKNKYRKQP